MAKKVSIVIPNWNGAEKLKQHLPKVLKVARLNKVEEVIVTDDASTDDSVKVLRSQFPEVVLVEKGENSGFASNVNFGVGKTCGDYIVLLNSDAHPKEDFLKFAMIHFENPRVFSVGCKVGGLWSIGKFENGFFWHGEAKPDGDISKPHQTLWASGGNSVFRKNLWDELGGFDPLYDPFYEEDVDLGYRATKRGYLNIWEPRSVIEHYKEVGVIASHFKKEYVSCITERNHLLFIWKNITSEKLISEHKKALMKMLLRHPHYWTVFIAALKKLPQVLRRRKIEKQEAKLTDEEIFRIFAQN